MSTSTLKSRSKPRTTRPVLRKLVKPKPNPSYSFNRFSRHSLAK